MIAYLLLEIILIVACLYKNAVIGVITWILIMFLQKKESMSSLDYWVRLICASIPVSYLEFTGEMGMHLFKWFHLAIVGLLITLLLPSLKEKLTVKKNTFLIFVILLALQFFRTLFSKDLGTALVELFQEYIIIIPAYLLWNYYVCNKGECLKQFSVSQWLEIYKNTAFAASIGLLIQYGIYIFTGTKVGYISFLGGRQIFDMTFTGYSVLSIYIGAAMVLAVKSILNKEKTFYNLLVLGISAFACTINSSRSGFYAAIIIIAIILFDSLRDAKSSVRTVIFGIPIAIIAVVAFGYLIQTRSSLQDGNILYSAGRDDLIMEAVKLMTNNFVFFLCGTGINGTAEYGLNAQHNMFLEFWLDNGTVLFLVFAFVIAYIMWKTRKLESRFLLWHLLLSHQFVSSFFSTTFMLPILLLLIGEYYQNKHLRLAKKENFEIRE